MKLEKTTTQALSQIKKREYPKKFLDRGKRVLLLGVNVKFVDGAQLITAVKELVV